MNQNDLDTISAMFGRLWKKWYTVEIGVLIGDLFRPYPFEIVSDCVKAYWIQNPDSFKPKLGDIRADVKAKAPQIQHEQRWDMSHERSYLAENEIRYVTGQEEKTVFEFCRERAIRPPSVNERADVQARLENWNRQYCVSQGLNYEEFVGRCKGQLERERVNNIKAREASRNDPRCRKMNDVIERLEKRYTA